MPPDHPWTRSANSPEFIPFTLITQASRLERWHSQLHVPLVPCDQDPCKSQKQTNKDTELLEDKALALLVPVFLQTNEMPGIKQLPVMDLVNG